MAEATIDPFEGIQTIQFESEKEWEVARRLVVGSSDMAGLVGYGYASQTPVTIWAEKTGNAKMEWDKEQEQLLAIGHAAEPYARQSFQIVTGLKVHWDSVKTIRCNPDYPAFGASLDSWTFMKFGSGNYEPGDELAVVECKVINPRDLWMYQLDELPLKFCIQIQHQMATVDANHGFVVAVCGTEIVIRYVPRHQELIDGLHAQAEEFLECVVTNEAPEMDGSKETAQVLTRIWPTVDPSKICMLPAKFNGFAGRRDELKAQEKEIAAAIEKLNSEIKYEMKDAQYAVTEDDQAFSWKQTAKGRSFLRLDKIPLAVRKAIETRQKETELQGTHDG